MSRLQISGAVQLNEAAGSQATSSLTVTPTDSSEQPLTIADSAMATARLLPEPMPRLSVSPALFDQLSTCSAVSLEGQLEAEQKTVNNIVGVWKGSSSQDALIISAHLDHVGGFGETHYPGALDNAAGLATLLQLAQLVKDQSLELPFDLVFCAFNGEDMGQQGSNAFCTLPLPYEQVNAINLDTVGMTGVAELAVSNTAEQLSSQLISYLNSAGLDCVLAEEMGLSDHEVLVSHGIPAVNLGDSGTAYASIIHTPGDTAEGIDVARLHKLAQALADYLKTAEITPPGLTPGASTQDDERALWTEAHTRAQVELSRYQPAQDEVVFFELDGASFIAWNVIELTDITEIMEQYPGFPVPETLGDFTFEWFRTFYEDYQLQRVFPQNGYSTAPVQQKTGQELGSDYILRYVNQNDESQFILIYLRDNSKSTLQSHLSINQLEDGGTDEVTTEYGTVYQYFAKGAQLPWAELFYHQAGPYSFEFSLGWSGLDSTDAMLKLMTDYLSSAGL